MKRLFSRGYVMLRLQADCDEKWSYHNSFFFAGTLGKGLHRLNNIMIYSISYAMNRMIWIV